MTDAAHPTVLIHDSQCESIPGHSVATYCGCALRAENDALREALVALIRFDDDPRVSGYAAIHRYQCPATRYGRTVRGPCDCGGDAVQAAIKSAWQSARGCLAATPKEKKE